MSRKKSGTYVSAKDVATRILVVSTIAAGVFYYGGRGMDLVSEVLTHGQIEDSDSGMAKDLRDKNKVELTDTMGLLINGRNFSRKTGKLEYEGQPKKEVPIEYRIKKRDAGPAPSIEVLVDGYAMHMHQKVEIDPLTGDEYIIGNGKIIETFEAESSDPSKPAVRPSYKVQLKVRYPDGEKSIDVDIIPKRVIPMTGGGTTSFSRTLKDDLFAGSRQKSFGKQAYRFKNGNSFQRRRMGYRA